VRRLPGSLPGITPAERRADAAVHVVGLTLAVIASLALLWLALPGASVPDQLTILTYVLGLFAMVGCSALYHLSRDPARRRLFRRFDHAAIFLMIAGTYTPLLTIAAGERRALLLLAAVWAVALAGAAIKLLALHVPGWLSVALYLALGWTIVLTPGEVTAALSARSLTLLVAGGLVYTTGVLFYVWERLRFHTAIWHAFVLLGAGLHYGVILQVVAG
jgi:hemolysin III